MLWVFAGLLVVIIILSLRAYSVFVLQVPRYKAYWNQQKSVELETGAIRYFALGDSAAQGVGASKPEKGYVGLLAARIGKKTGRPVRVFNLSVSGAKAKDVLEKQLPELGAYNVTDKDIITLAVGGNDMRSFDTADFKETFKELAAGLPKQTIVADVPYFGGGRENQHQQRALAASEIISAETAAAGLRLAKLQVATRKNNSWRNYAADFFHPSDYGYRWWAEPFWDQLEPVTSDQG